MMVHTVACLKKSTLFYFIFLFNSVVFAQSYTITGRVTDTLEYPISGALVFLDNTSTFALTDTLGIYLIEGITGKAPTMIIQVQGKNTFKKKLVFPKNYSADASKIIVDVILKEEVIALSEISIEAERERTSGLGRLNSIERFGIYEGKKRRLCCSRI